MFEKDNGKYYKIYKFYLEEKIIGEVDEIEYQPIHRYNHLAFTEFDKLV